MEFVGLTVIICKNKVYKAVYENQKVSNRVENNSLPLKSSEISWSSELYISCAKIPCHKGMHSSNITILLYRACFNYFTVVYLVCFSSFINLI